jgi:hypothetical protein
VNALDVDEGHRVARLNRQFSGCEFEVLEDDGVVSVALGICIPQGQHTKRKKKNES